MNSFYPIVKVKRLKDVPLPAYAHDGDAGLDLCATEDVTLYPGDSCKMGSGIAVAIPHGFAGFVLPRSGLGCKGLVIKNGTGLIDAGYRGEIGLTLFNNNPTHVWYAQEVKTVGGTTYTTAQIPVSNTKGTIHVHKGDRVAQLVILPIGIAQLVEVEELDETDRNTGGFGSTGITGGQRL